MIFREKLNKYKIGDKVPLNAHTMNVQKRYQIFAYLGKILHYSYESMDDGETYTKSLHF